MSERVSITLSLTPGTARTCGTRDVACSSPTETRPPEYRADAASELHGQRIERFRLSPTSLVLRDYPTKRVGGSNWDCNSCPCYVCNNTSE